MTETKKKERELKISLIVVGSLGLLFSIYGLATNWDDSNGRWTMFMGGICGLTLLFSGLGFIEPNGKLKRP